MVTKALSSWAALLKSICFLNFPEYNEINSHTSSAALKKRASCGCISEGASGQLFWNKPSSYTLQICQAPKLARICPSTYHLPDDAVCRGCLRDRVHGEMPQKPHDGICILHQKNLYTSLMLPHKRISADSEETSASKNSYNFLKG